VGSSFTLPKLGLLGGARGHAALGDVLPAAPRRLHHLVVGARTAVDQPVAENNRGVVNDLCALVGLQPAEPAVGVYKAALFDQFLAPVARMANVYAPSTRSYHVSKFYNFIDMFLQRVETIDTLF